MSHPGMAGAMQPVRIGLPSEGTVTFYEGSARNSRVLTAPAQAGMQVGSVYRFRISDLPEFPGVELFPTVEILDRLHPPPGLELEFPLPIEITMDDVEIVLQDRMVTKVVYLEQPDLAAPVTQQGKVRVENLPPSTNLLQAADVRGRPMAIVRMGGRVPDLRAPCDDFFSQSPLLFATPNASR
jgi:hypothetical protein